MQDEIIALLSPRKGHFRFESGHHGDLWLELAPLYRDPKRLQRFAAALAARLAAHDIQAVCGPLVEGAFLAQLVALELGAEFYFAERVGQPSNNRLFPVTYRIPVALRALLRDKRAAVVDDIFNAGSATRGAFADLQACEARPVAIGALLVLGSAALEFAAEAGIPLENLGQLDNNLWEPSACPQCASGMPLS